LSWRAYEAGQVQAGPQEHIAPHAQPARRFVAVAWHPHSEHVPHEQAFVVLVM
jgi:hypothetical protein